MSLSKSFMVLGLVCALGACTYGSDLERGAVGAAVGAVTADAVNESPTVGAAVGAAVGVLADDI